MKSCGKEKRQDSSTDIDTKKERATVDAAKNCKTSHFRKLSLFFSFSFGIATRHAFQNELIHPGKPHTHSRDYRYVSQPNVRRGALVFLMSSI